jgi:hypothetical protein
MVGMVVTGSNESSSKSTKHRSLEPSQLCQKFSKEFFYISLSWARKSFHMSGCTGNISRRSRPIHAKPKEATTLSWRRCSFSSTTPALLHQSEFQQHEDVIDALIGRAVRYLTPSHDSQTVMRRGELVVVKDRSLRGAWRIYRIWKGGFCLGRWGPPFLYIRLEHPLDFRSTSNFSFLPFILSNVPRHVIHSQASQLQHHGSSRWTLF